MKQLSHQVIQVERDSKYKVMQIHKHHWTALLHSCWKSSLIFMYARDNKLLDTYGWKRFRSFGKNQPKMFHTSNQPKLRAIHTTPRYKYGFEFPRNYDHTLRIDNKTILIDVMMYLFGNVSSRRIQDIPPSINMVSKTRNYDHTVLIDNKNKNNKWQDVTHL